MYRKIQIISVVMLVFYFIMSNLNAQNAVALRQPANEKSIPKIVIATFKNQYSNVILKDWYVTHLTYWQNDYSSDWYSGWYYRRTLIIHTYEKPNYFEVEFFVHPDELSRAIYNRYGYWYETRTRINGLTMAIHDSLRASGYKDWNLSAMKEKIASPAWPKEIYRFQVSKGIKSRIVRMDAEGNIIQVKELKD